MFQILYRIDGFSREHIYMFPHGRQIRVEEIKELKADLTYQMFGEPCGIPLSHRHSIYCTVDKKTSKGSTAPYSVDDIDHLLRVLKEVHSSIGIIIASVPGPTMLLNITSKRTKKHSHNMW